MKLTRKYVMRVIIEELTLIIGTPSEATEHRLKAIGILLELAPHLPMGEDYDDD